MAIVTYTWAPEEKRGRGRPRQRKSEKKKRNERSRVELTEVRRTNCSSTRKAENLCKGVDWRLDARKR